MSLTVASTAFLSQRRLLPCTQENSAERAMSFETGRVSCGNRGNWMILPVEGGAVFDGDSSEAPAMILPRRSIRSEERRVGKSVDLGGRRIIKKKKKNIKRSRFSVI